MVMNINYVTQMIVKRIATKHVIVPTLLMVMLFQLFFIPDHSYFYPNTVSLNAKLFPKTIHCIKLLNKLFKRLIALNFMQ